MINTMLHNELNALYENLKSLIRDSESLTDGSAGGFRNLYCKQKIREALDMLHPISNLLDLHLKLDDTTLTSVDFYDIFNTQFVTGRYNKRAK